MINQFTPDHQHWENYVTHLERHNMARNADYIITNSFHCTIYSTMFSKKVRVYLPKKGSQRIRELIDCCDLNHMLDDEQWMDTYDRRFDTAEQYMKRERERSMEFLSGL